jgi:sulfite exporter TauE/SafE
MSVLRPPALPIDPDTDAVDMREGAPRPGAIPVHEVGTVRDSEAVEARREPIAHVRRHPLAPKQYLWIVGALLVLCLALAWLGPVLTPFLIGAILAYLGTPLVTRAERRGAPRSLATLLVILLIMLLLAALFLVMIPLVQSEVASSTRRLPALFSQFTDRVAP